MLFAFSIAPATAPEPDGSMSAAVAEAIRVVRASALPHETTSMFTSIVDLGHGSFIRPAGI
ncbi:thiamine-binding protein [Dietzia sp.]|uniref:thiamine-binding protein n=1 Tax=Dietzia sp. TaxID=1871616 RepID=UPI003FA53E6A